MFEKNINALHKTNPNLAEKLKNIFDTKFEIFEGDDPANLNFIDTKNFKPIYDKPLEETLQKVEEFKNYKNYPILFFFGLGNGIFYRLLLDNPKHNKIVIFEPDLEIIYLALHFVDFSTVIDRIEIIYSKDYQFINALKLFENWEYRFFLKTYDLHIHTKYYSDLYQDELLRVNKINIEAIKHIVTSHGNDSTDAVIGVKHTFHNISEMVQNYKFKDLLKNKPLNDTAIIVSTGPSLNKQLPLLKQIQNYATIISVDASLPILEKEGIKPDFVCVLERVEATSNFFKKTSKEFMKDIYFVIAALAHEATLKEITGKKIITLRPFHYARFLKLDEFGYIGIGMSAANMAFELAYLLGHKKTILIGQDLAYSEDGSSHANGHVFGKNEIKFKETDIYVEKYGGGGLIRTYKFWNIFRETFEKDIAESKNMITINSTEGGARIHGALEIPFKEAIKDLNQEKKKVKLQKITQNESKNYLQKAIKKIEEGIKIGEEKKKKFEKMFLKVAEAWDELVFLNKTNQLEKIDFEKLTKISDELDEIKEILNEETFQELFFDVLQPFLVNAELNLATVIVKPTNTEIEKQAKIIDWVMKHKEWLFIVAGSIDTQIKIMQEELEFLKNSLKTLN